MSPLRDRYLTELSIDVDRLGVHALEETARRLELLPLKRPDADSCKPSTLRLQCSHGVARSAVAIRIAAAIAGDPIAAFLPLPMDLIETVCRRVCGWS